MGGDDVTRRAFDLGAPCLNCKGSGLAKDQWYW